MFTVANSWGLGGAQVAQQMAAMQEAMKRPEAQQQMEQMAAAMQNQQLQQRMATLKVGHAPMQV